VTERPWGGFGRIQSETTVRQKMGRTLLWLVNGDDGEYSPDSSDAEGVKRRGLLRELEGIQEDTERDYSQRKYGKNALVIGNGDDRDDRENPRRCRFKVEETTNRKGSST
jgi:hypothetical protein